MLTFFLLELVLSNDIDLLALLVRKLALFLNLDHGFLVLSLALLDLPLHAGKFFFNVAFHGMELLFDFNSNFLHLAFQSSLHLHHILFDLFFLHLYGLLDVCQLQLVLGAQTLHNRVNLLAKLLALGSHQVKVLLMPLLRLVQLSQYKLMVTVFIQNSLFHSL